jgi:hypothetical protein
MGWDSVAVSSGESIESEQVAEALTPFVEQLLEPWEDYELPDPIELPTRPYEALLAAIEGAREAHAGDSDVGIMLDRWLRDAYVLAGDFETAWKLTKSNDGFYVRNGVNIWDVLQVRNHCADDSLDGYDLLALARSEHNLTPVGIRLRGRVEVHASALLAQAQAELGCNVVKDFVVRHDERVSALSGLARELSNPHNFAYGFFAEAKTRIHHRLWRTFPPWLRPELMTVLNDILRQAEDLARSEAGLPKVSEGWVSEAELFCLLKAAFLEHQIVQHGSPSWLNPQHLDIYFPNERVAVEFQGEQHFKPVALFGGEESFAAQQEHDKRKRDACARNDCALLEVAQGYQFEDIHAWVAESLNRKRPRPRNRVGG